MTVNDPNFWTRMNNEKIIVEHNFFPVGLQCNLTGHSDDYIEDWAKGIVREKKLL